MAVPGGHGGERRARRPGSAGEPPRGGPSGVRPRAPVCPETSEGPFPPAASPPRGRPEPAPAGSARGPDRPRRAPAGREARVGVRAAAGLPCLPLAWPPGRRGERPGGGARGRPRPGPEAGAVAAGRGGLQWRGQGSGRARTGRLTALMGEGRRQAISESAAGEGSGTAGTSKPSSPSGQTPRLSLHLWARQAGSLVGKPRPRVGRASGGRRRSVAEGAGPAQGCRGARRSSCGAAGGPRVEKQALSVG